MDDNAAIVQRAFDTWRDEGLEAALAYLDPDVEWWGPEEWLEERLYRGHDGIRRLAAFWGAAFDQYGVELDEVRDVDGAVLALGRQVGRMKGTGDPIEQPVAYIVEFRAGKVSRVDVYFAWDAAVDAAERHARHSE